MGVLFEYKQKLDTIIQQRSLDPAATKGAIGMKAGFLIGMIGPTTPDDPAKVAKLKQVVQEVLNVTL